jgi:hypothetical protein
MAKGAGISTAAKFGESFIEDGRTLAINGFDTIRFDTNVVGRQHETNSIIRDAKVSYGDGRFTIAVWNMHVHCSEDNFDNLLTTGIKNMGNGGGFLVVLFRGRGTLTNQSHDGNDNWYSAKRAVLALTMLLHLHQLRSSKYPVLGCNPWQSKGSSLLIVWVLWSRVYHRLFYLL